MGDDMANYRIEDIEGIGSTYGQKLRTAGITSTGKLLLGGCNPSGRKAITRETGIDEKLILKWVNMADLYRVWGIGKQYAELLEISGVDTVRELRHRNPVNLYQKMVEVNATGKPMVRLLPGMKRVEGWISHAKVLDPLVNY